MTHVEVFKKNNHIYKVVCDGHTNYGVAGEDIVCASLSSIVQTAVLGLMCVVSADVDLDRDEERGFLSMTIVEELSGDRLLQADAILDTMLCGISDLYNGFSDFIDLEVKS